MKNLFIAGVAALFLSLSTMAFAQAPMWGGGYGMGPGMMGPGYGGYGFGAQRPQSGKPIDQREAKAAANPANVSQTASRWLRVKRQ